MPPILVIFFVIALVLHILWTHLVNTPNMKATWVNLGIIVLILFFFYFTFPAIKVR